MTVTEMIESLRDLEKRDPNMQVYFDCPHCGRSNTMARVDHVVLLRQKTEEQADANLPK